MKITNIDHLQIAIPKDSEFEAKKFYCEILGLKEIPKPEALAKRRGFWLANENFSLHVGVEENFKPSKKSYIAFLVRDLNEAKEALLSKKIKVKEDFTYEKINRFYIFDTFGNRLEFIQNGKGFSQQKVDFQFRVEEISEREKLEVSQFFKNAWGSNEVVSRGKLHSYKNLEGFFVKENEKLIGIANYRIENEELELVSLYCLIRKRGIGTALVKNVIQKAKENNCSRLWLVVTNDNLNAFRFYQRLGFEMCAFYENALKESRKLKSQIPLTGIDKIPIKHEIEFELKC